jgi:Cys-Gly metallodipeptidase DUG1
LLPVIHVQLTPPPVSGDASYRPKVFEMGQWLQSECGRLNITTEVRDPGVQILEGKTLQLPPVILGRYGSDPAKKTVLVYGHYDVQPALLEDGWSTDPWVLTEKDGKLYGRGSTDDKAPILGLFYVCL